jgi:hypothetical protein
MTAVFPIVTRTATLAEHYVVQVPPEAKSHACFSCLKFSGDGKYILGVVDGRIYVLDSFQVPPLSFLCPTSRNRKIQKTKSVMN